MNQKEAVHERLKEYACVAPDQMMQKLQINAEGITQDCKPEPFSVIEFLCDHESDLVKTDQ